MLSDLGQPPADVIARALGVSVRSVYGWQSRETAPRPVLLAIFYQTRWGQSAVAADAVNGARVARALADSLERENATLSARVAYLERVGQFGSANAPTLARPPLIWCAP